MMTGMIRWLGSAYHLLRSTSSGAWPRIRAACRRGLRIWGVDQDHADALAHRARDLAVEVVAAAELLGVDEQFVFVVEIRLQVAAQGVGQRGLERCMSSCRPWA
jgi:hypothetical protein